MKNISLIVALVLSLFVNSQELTPMDTMINYYFNEIAHGGDLSGYNEISKYKKDVYIYAYGQTTEDRLSELTDIVNELNDLINPIQFYITKDKDQSNIQVFFGSADEFKVINPRSAKYLNGNYGLFEYHLEDNNEISYSLVFIDVVRTSSEDGIKHLLREELTQSLGLGNDSFRFPESIFYQGWTTTTEYAEIDKKIIQMLYNEGN